MPRLTLNRVFAASLLGLLAGMGLLFWLVFHGLHEALLRSASQARDRDSTEVAQSVTDYLGHAPGAVDKFESLLHARLANASDATSLRDSLLTLLIHNTDISEATFTFGESRGKDSQGNLIIDPASAGQVSIFRALSGNEFVHRHTWYLGGRYVSTHTHIAMNGAETEVETPTEVPNPTAHATFTTPVRKDIFGAAVWTDLHWFSIDQNLPVGQRRIEVSVQKAIQYPAGHFAGVLRIGMFKNAIDRAVTKPPGIDTKTHEIFICDSDGRLIAISGSSPVIESGDDLRLSPAGAPASVLAAVKDHALGRVTTSGSSVPGQFAVGGTTYLCTFRSLPQSQDWIVGMVVPEKAYLGDLWKIRRRVVWGSIILVTVISLLGGVILYTVSVAHAVILREAALMNDFVLDPSKNDCAFVDISRVLTSLERAKTAMRSMGKYVPMDLVRRLYHRGEEPRLGGETTLLTLLFTDIRNFTGFAEARDPDEVAIHLGAYLGVLASVIQKHRGTIDKFIGDSVMTFWNAPEPVEGYSALACEAALEARDALEGLYKSPAWDGLPAFQTRFGLHHCMASVGHFGSPERFNYTAIGDGVNVASRLEGLNKHYGTTIMASDSLREAAGPGFRWRRLDRVAVKGKTQGLDVYELVGKAEGPAPEWIAIYEAALQAYFDGDFERAIELACGQTFDAPSAVLCERCRELIAEPPRQAWDGVYVFETK